MSTESVQPIVSGLIELWETAKPASGAALEDHDDSLPFDYDQVGEEDVALAAPDPPIKHKVVVAEGDSWFDYPIKGDLLDALRKRHGYTIYQVSKAGGLLEDMVYGVKKSFWGGTRPQIVETMDEVSKRKPSMVLFSGGGNDIAGHELVAFINRRASGVSPLRDGAVDHLIFEVFRRAYDVFIGTMKTLAEKGDFELNILGHTYDLPNPDGRGYSITNWIPGFSYVGPWLKPAFDAKGYSIDEGREMIEILMKKFAKLHEDLANDHDCFSSVNSQGTLVPLSTDDWDNEMHPTWGGFKAIAVKVNDAIQAT